MAAGSARTTWSYSRPLHSEAGTTLSRPLTSRPSFHSADVSASTSASAAITPTEPSNVSASRTAATTPSPSPAARVTRSRPSDRYERVAGTCTSSAVSSVLASSTTAAGTRKPVVSAITSPSGLPSSSMRGAHEVAAHGVVPCARSPSTVSEPCSLRLATARHSMGDRSWASSTMTCP